MSKLESQNDSSKLDFLEVRNWKLDLEFLISRFQEVSPPAGGSKSKKSHFPPQKLLVCILAFNFLLITFYLREASARSFSLSVWPPLTEIMVKPGKSLTQTYQLTNGQDPTTLVAKIVRFQPSDEKGHLRLGSDFSSQPPLHFALENANLALGEPFTLLPEESKQILLRLTTFPETPEGDYYLTLLFISNPENLPNLQGPQQSGALGANLLITVTKDGKLPKTGKIQEFKLLNCLPRWPEGLLRGLIPNTCFLDSLDKPDFLLRIQNSSRTFWKPFGMIKINGSLEQNWEGKLQPDNILAGSTREIQLATDSATPRFLAGRFRAKVEFNPDQTGPLVTDAITFIVLPIKITIGIVMALIFLAVIKKKLRRRQE